MKKTALFFLAIFLPTVCVTPCTTFVLKTKNGLFFGRNLDWVSDHGLVVVNQKNVNKSSFVFAPEKSISWTSKYGSISFNQFGKEFPFGGINEKGLVVEIMISPAEYPEPDERPVVNELQWVQYQLDNSATIEDVIATDAVVRIGQTHENLHYLVCDAKGKAVVIECIDGKMKYYKGNDLPLEVLENEPYHTSIKNYRNNESCRFTKAANMIEQYHGDTPAVEYSFKILEEVALSAEWSIVYDVTNLQIYFRTNSVTDVRSVSLKNFDYSCTTNAFSYSLANKDAGEVDSKFIQLNAGTNEEILTKAISINALPLEQEQLTQLIRYFKECPCAR